MIKKVKGVVSFVFLILIITSFAFVCVSNFKSYSSQSSVTVNVKEMVETTISKIDQSLTGESYYTSVELDSNVVAKYRLLAGKLDNLNEYPLQELGYYDSTHGGRAFISQDKLVGVTLGGNMQMQNSVMEKPIIEFTAVEDIALTFNHQGFTSNFALYNARALTQIFTERNGVMYLARNHSLINEATQSVILGSTSSEVTASTPKIVVDENDYGETFHLNAGDKFYLTTDSMEKYSADLALKPSFNISTTQFEEEKAVAESGYNLLSITKEVATTIKNGGYSVEDNLVSYSIKWGDVASKSLNQFVPSRVTVPTEKEYLKGYAIAHTREDGTGSYVGVYNNIDFWAQNNKCYFVRTSAKAGKAENPVGNLIFEFTAKKDVTISLSHGEFLTAYTYDLLTSVRSGLKYTVKQGEDYYIAKNNQTENLVTPVVVNETKTVGKVAENALSATVSLKAGETLYIEYTSKNTYATYDMLLPEFVVSSNYQEEFRPSKNESTVRPSSLISADMVTYQIAEMINGGYEVPTPYYDYGYYYGSFENLNRYTSYEGDGTGTSADILKGGITTVSRWQSKCIDSEFTVLKITAKQNLKITFSFESDASHNFTAWATDSSYLYLGEGVASDGNRYVKQIERKWITINAEKDYYGISVNLKEGDVLYLSYETEYNTIKTQSRWYKVSVDETAYDETLRPDYEGMKIVSETRASTITALEEYIVSLDVNQKYSLDNALLIDNLLSKAKDDIKKAQTLEKISSINEKVMQEISSIKTLEQEEQDRIEAVNDGKAKLKAYFEGLNEKDYDAETWKQIKDLYTQGIYKIDKASNATKAKTEYENYLGRIKATVERYNSSKGCNSSLVQVLPVVVSCSVIATLWLFLKKRRSK